jgi:hypothetical protein
MPRREDELAERQPAAVWSRLQEHLLEQAWSMHRKPSTRGAVRCTESPGKSLLTRKPQMAAEPYSSMLAQCQHGLPPSI